MSEMKGYAMEEVAENTGQTEKGCVYIQYSLAVWHGGGKQRTYKVLF